jgi:MFS family permease
MRFSRTVYIVSFVSLFADMASEMLFALTPIYLKQIGFAALWIGIVEAVAEFTAGISKGYFAEKSDAVQKRVLFIKGGYALSAISKPLIGLTKLIGVVLFARVIDRLGKGMRVAARDAVLDAQCSNINRGAVFGFHRSMDTVGAVLGPLVAIALLYFFNLNLQQIFLWAIVPGAISVALCFFLKEEKLLKPTKTKVGFFSFFGYWKKSTTSYKKLVLGLIALAFVNSSDVFLLLQVFKTIPATDPLLATLVVYVFYNTIYALLSYPLGHMADRFGFKPTLVAGIFVFALVYFLMAFANASWHFYAIFALYGAYAAATEGISKAWLISLANPTDKATAVGFYTAWQSMGGVFANIVVAGAVWTAFGATTVFMSTALVATAVAIYILSNVKKH